MGLPKTKSREGGWGAADPFVQASEAAGQHGTQTCLAGVCGHLWKWGD